MTAKEYIVRSESGVEVFQIDPNVTKIVIDISHVRRKAIEDFVSKYAGTVHSADLSQKIVALAVGYYEVPIDVFYSDIKDIYKLSDSLLAAIVRWQAQAVKDRKREKTDV